MDVTFYIAQGFGALAVILGFISFQMKDAKKLLFIQCGVSAVFCVHFFLLGATTGFVLNVACILRNVAYYNKDKKYLSSIWVPIALSAMMGVLGVIFWEAWYSVFFVVSLIANTFCMSFKSPENIRRSILFTSPLALTYDAFASAYGGVAYEAFVIVSSVIGIVRTARAKRRETNESGAGA